MHFDFLVCVFMRCLGKTKCMFGNTFSIFDADHWKQFISYFLVILWIWTWFNLLYIVDGERQFKDAKGTCILVISVLLVCLWKRKRKLWRIEKMSNFASYLNLTKDIQTMVTFWYSTSYTLRLVQSSCLFSLIKWESKE